MCVLMGLDEACHLASQFEYDARLVGWYGLLKNIVHGYLGPH